MTRRAYGFAVGLALAVGIFAWVTSYRYNLPLRDPDGLAGPSYIRLPLIVMLFYVADVVPRALIANRGFRHFLSSVREYTSQRWDRSRVQLVVVGLVSFYVVYVAYRNLKGFLPEIRLGVGHDPLLQDLDRALFFGHDPADVLHTMLGTGATAHILSFVYVSFLLFVPLSLGAALVWSKNVSTGFWYVTALCINWVLGAASYYWLPSLGPYFANRSLFLDLPDTGVTKLQQALESGRARYVEDPFSTESVQSIAAFASLHVSIIFTAALICHYIIPSRYVRWAMWAYFVLTSLATVYFGWHYLIDDVAGLAIGFLAVWIGAKTTGHFLGKQRHSSSWGDGIIGVFPPASARSPEPASGLPVDAEAVLTPPAARDTGDADWPSAGNRPSRSDGGTGSTSSSV
ncbi:MAG: phosphatase PAP2 family protein [Nocardioidaceae bacterium]